MKKRDAILSAIVLVAALGFIGYRQFFAEVPTQEEEVVAVTKEEETLRELSTTVTYPVPGKSDTVIFTLMVDKDNAIRGVKSVDVNDPSHQVKLDEFSAKLLPIIEGKKLEELEAVDRVGTSTLTTDAFNSGLEAIKAQA